jgi:serine/threonine-protein kinase
MVVRRVLARGGMSIVYEAEDTLLRRRVAIKAAHDPEVGAAMLLHEARALAAIRHAGLPAIYGVGAQDGATYLAFERLYGATLEDRLQRGGVLAADEVVRILSGVADVLAAVHATGMVHHDLKPGNVMLCAGDRVVVLDFGIMVPQVAAGDAARCGTPRYLAPEVILDRVAPGRGTAIDVYAFGVMAFEMLAGRAPFEDLDVVRVLEHHVGTPPPDLAKLRPDMPVALTTLIQACIAKSIHERPDSIASILWELRGIARRLDATRTTGRLPKIE